MYTHPHSEDRILNPMMALGSYDLQERRAAHFRSARPHAPDVTFHELTPDRIDAQIGQARIAVVTAKEPHRPWDPVLREQVLSARRLYWERWGPIPLEDVSDDTARSMACRSGWTQMLQARPMAPPRHCVSATQFPTSVHHTAARAPQAPAAHWQAPSWQCRTGFYSAAGLQLY
jgi:hypothetical protein